MTNKKILVLGGDGFVGSHVMEELRGKGYECFSKSRRNGIDLTNQNAISQVFKEITPDVIINCAAHVGGIHYLSEHSAEVLDDNLRMMLNLYQAVQKVCPEVKVINPISNCSYPGEANLHREKEWWDGPVHKSVWAFANPKRMLQVISECYFMQYRLESINFFVPNAYGPGDYTDPNRTHALNGMIIRMLKAKENDDKEFVIWGSGKPTREWIYVKDLARMLVESIESQGLQIDPVNIAQNHAYAIRETAEMIKELCNFKGLLIFDENYQDGAPFKQLDDSLFRKKYPDFQYTPIRGGIADTITYYESVL